MIKCFLLSTKIRRITEKGNVGVHNPSCACRHKRSAVVLLQSMCPWHTKVIVLSSNSRLTPHARVCLGWSLYGSSTPNISIVSSCMVHSIFNFLVSVLLKINNAKRGEKNGTNASPSSLSLPSKGLAML